jgi:hypothetical protein
MTPVTSTPERLILRRRPWVLGLLLSAILLLFIGIGLSKLLAGEVEEAGKLALLVAMFAVAFAVFVRQDVAIFDRPSGQIALRRAGVFGQAETLHPLDGLDHAEIGTDEGGDPDNPRTLTRPVLVYADGRKVPMTSVFSSGAGAGNAVRAINGWLGGTGP